MAPQARRAAGSAGARAEADLALGLALDGVGADGGMRLGHAMHNNNNGMRDCVLGVMGGFGGEEDSVFSDSYANPLVSMGGCINLSPHLSPHLSPQLMPSSADFMGGVGGPGDTNMEEAGADLGLGAAGGQGLLTPQAMMAPAGHDNLHSLRGLSDSGMRGSSAQWSQDLSNISHMANLDQDSSLLDTDIWHHTHPSPSGPGASGAQSSSSVSSSRQAPVAARSAPPRR